MKRHLLAYSTLALLLLAAVPHRAQAQFILKKMGTLIQPPVINPAMIKGAQPNIKPVPMPTPKPMPMPTPPGPQPNPNADWWKPLANPGNWIGLLGQGRRPRHPHYPTYPTYPSYPNQPSYPTYPPISGDPSGNQVDPGFNPNYGQGGSAPGGSQGQSAPSAPLPDNSLDAPVELFNPSETGTVIRCLINGQLVELQPGQRQKLPAGGKWTVQFHRGGDFGRAEYEMNDGLHWFKRTSRGWELYRGDYRPSNKEKDQTSKLPANPW